MFICLSDVGVCALCLCSGRFTRRCLRRQQTGTVISLGWPESWRETASLWCSEEAEPGKAGLSHQPSYNVTIIVYCLVTAIGRLSVKQLISLSQPSLTGWAKAYEIQSMRSFWSVNNNTATVGQVTLVLCKWTTCQINPHSVKWNILRQI